MSTFLLNKWNSLLSYFTESANDLIIQTTEATESDDFVEILIKENGWVDTATTKIKNSTLLSIVRNHFDWTAARGYIINNTIYSEEPTLVEINIIDDDNDQEDKIEDNNNNIKSDWVMLDSDNNDQVVSISVSQRLIIHYPEHFPSFDVMQGEILIVFGDKGNVLKNEEKLHANHHNIHTDCIFDRDLPLHERRFNKENVIRCNDQNVYQISALINTLKHSYGNSFTLIYYEDILPLAKKQDENEMVSLDSEPVIRFVRINCDDRDIGIVWAERITSNNKEDFEINSKRVETNDGELLINSRPFYKSRKFVVFVKADPLYFDEKKKVDLLIVDDRDNPDWILQRTIIMHKLIKRQ